MPNKHANILIKNYATLHPVGTLLDAGSRKRRFERGAAWACPAGQSWALFAEEQAAQQIPARILIEAETMAQTLEVAAHSTKISSDALDQRFRQARTHSAWLPTRVSLETLREVYELARMGPTSVNSNPARFVFLESAAAKARLVPALSPGNVEKTKAAPVTVIVAWDTEFHEKLPQLFPHKDMRSHFAGKPSLIDETAMRNGSLEGGYFILSARALGLDCGPISGFDAAKVHAEFFPDGVKVVEKKEERHHIGEPGFVPASRTMVHIGG